jgi:DNA polymerase III sliding clamp (beta) subunit (PCNA family)
VSTVSLELSPPKLHLTCGPVQGEVETLEAVPDMTPPAVSSHSPSATLPAMSCLTALKAVRFCVSSDKDAEAVMKCVAVHFDSSVVRFQAIDFHKLAESVLILDEVPSFSVLIPSSLLDPLFKTKSDTITFYQNSSSNIVRIEAEDSILVAHTPSPKDFPNLPIKLFSQTVHSFSIDVDDFASAVKWAVRTTTDKDYFAIRLSLKSSALEISPETAHMEIPISNLKSSADLPWSAYFAGRELLELVESYPPGNITVSVVSTGQKIALKLEDLSTTTILMPCT